jgi:phenylalanyl-tRNA synthetase alpha chain
MAGHSRSKNGVASLAYGPGHPRLFDIDRPRDVDVRIKSGHDAVQVVIAMSDSEKSDLDSLQSQILSQIAAATDEAALEAVRIATLGKKGSISALLSTLGKMSPDERKTEGAKINLAKDAVTEALGARREVLKAAGLDARLASETIDVTLPLRETPAEAGRIHPLSQVWDEVTTIFADMGFAVAEGPDIETDDYNFTRLNFPEGHPAREMHDTFYFNPKKETGSEPGADPGSSGAGDSRLLLRTHTSPVQVRTMLSQKPPIRVICPGRTYRSDSDQTHTPMFHQVEGLVIDKSSHLGHLKWILHEFCKAFFEVDNVNMRFRPSFFPFTEPSLEVDIQCRRDKHEIRFGEGEDWLEILGCGMVHPNVLRLCGIDPEVYQGFAWGMGIDRIAMLKYGIADLRQLFEGDVRWLNHYGFRPLEIPTLAGGLST